MNEKTNENESNKNVNKEVKNNKLDEKIDKEVENKNTEEISKKISEKNEKDTEKEKNKSSKNKKEEPKKSLAREAIEWVVCIVVAFALALIIKYYIFTPTLVMQASMTPTILSGERVLINRLLRTFNWDLERGDIITFEAPVYHELKNDEITAKYYEVEGLIDSFVYNVIEHGKTSYIKRVIGLPGDLVEIKNGEVYVNGELLEEDYLPETTTTYIPEGGMPSSFVVPEGYIFAMGDNREHSTDCRSFGCVPLEKIEGRVTIRIWPLHKIGGIDK